MLMRSTVLKYNYSIVKETAMELVKATDYTAMSRLAAARIAAQLMQKPASVLGLATGSTPIGLYQKLVEWNKNGDIDFSRVHTVNLDEYVSLGADHDQSYAYFMLSNLFSHVNINIKNTNLPNGLAADIDAECARYDALIESFGTIDMQLLGIGHNGHIGFNEPGSIVAGTHRVKLTKSTISANSRLFASEDEVPRYALTMGMKHIMQAKRVLVVANGEGKAEVVKRAFFGEITPDVPASLLQLHPALTVVVDEAAASRL